MEIARTIRYWALTDKGQVHSLTLKFFSILHDVNRPISPISQLEC